MLRRHAFSRNGNGIGGCGGRVEELADCPVTCVREDAVDGEIARALEPLCFADDELAYLKSRVARCKVTWETERESALNAQRLRLSNLHDRLNRLTDAVIDGTIEKDLFERRKAAFLMEQKELEEKIAGLDANQRSVPDRLAEFLELAGTAYFQYKMALPEEKRDLLEMVTSNRRVNGRNVELTLSLPFSEVANRYENSNGTPYRYRPRTLDRLLERLIMYFENEMPDVN